MKASGEGAGQRKAGEPAVLFPRLRINDTDKSGPRAPPRNKMALYEQLTIPSNRFLPPLAPAAPHSQQYFSMEHGYPCPPHYLQPTLPYRRANVDNHSFHHPCMGVSGIGAVIYGDSEFCRVPDVQSTLSSKASRSGVKPVTGHGTNSSENSPGKKFMDDDNVGVSVQNSGVRCLQSSEVHGCCLSSFAGSSTMMHSLKTVDSHPEVLEHLRNSSELVSEFCGSKSGSCCREPLEDQTHEMQDEQICSRNTNSQSVMLEPQSSPQSQGKQRHICEKSVPQQINKGTCTAGLNTGTLGQCTTDIGESAAATQADLDFVDRNNKLEKDHNEIRSGVETKLYSCKHDVFSEVPRKPNEQTVGENIECSIGHDSSRNGFESFGEIHHGSGEALEPFPTGDRSGSDDSDLLMLGSDSEQKIMAMDVMKLVGQQQFWKARDAIIRQQQLFSDQVFELHKLIQVQRMIAEAPDSTPDDNMYCGSAPCTDRCKIGPCIDSADQDNRKSKNISVTGAPVAFSKDPTDHVLGQGPYSKIDYYTNWLNENSMLNYGPYGHMYLSPVPYSIPGGVVWGVPCPSLGFPASETPSSASLGSNQLAELPDNSHTIHSSLRTGQRSPFSRSHRQTQVNPDPSAFLHARLAHPFNSQGMTASPSSLIVPNHNKHGSVAGESQWVTRITGKSGFKNSKNPASHAEQTNFSTSAGACTSNMVSVTPNVDGNIAGQRVDQPCVAGWNIERVHCTYYDDHDTSASEGALERYPKRRRKIFGGIKEGKVPDEAESDEENAEHFLNALPLFPLSPGTNSSVRERFTTRGGNRVR